MGKFLLVIYCTVVALLGSCLPWDNFGALTASDKTTGLAARRNSRLGSSNCMTQEGC